MKGTDFRTSAHPLLWAAALVAAGLPTLLAYNLPPSATLLNQCVAVAAWGGWVMLLAPRSVPREAWPLLAALALVGGAALVSCTAGTLPRSLGLTALALLAAAAVLVVAGADAARRAEAADLFAALCFGLLAAGLLSAGVALVQVFAPGWADGVLIAHSGLRGRAVGNLRQPNHLASLLLWAAVAAVALHELRRLPRAALAASLLLLVFAIELTASRTGAVGLLLLLLWALLDRRLSPGARWLLAATPVVYAAAYGAMALAGDFSHQALGAEARLDSGGGGGDSPNSRLNIWRDAWALLRADPWTGVGFGEFNFAWSLTPFPGRPTAFFDHTHNLELQLAVELGAPLAALVLALLLWALLRGWQRAAAADGDIGVAARAALLLVLLIGVHSQVEYPLWYAYFLLPTAFAWGFTLALPDGAPVERALRPRAPLLGLAAGLALAVGGALAVLDLLQVAVIYAPTVGSAPLQQRIARGQRSVLFAHHADYAAATNEMPPAARVLGFEAAPHSLLDIRLMIAWARYLDQRGQVDLARSLAQRLREFRSDEATSFFAVCSRPGGAAAFQCQAPHRPHGWREFAAATRPH